MAITQDFIKAIQTIVQEKINQAGFDRTRIGLVLHHNTNNTYALKIDGKIYMAVPNMTNVTFSVGDMVKVTYPCGNISEMYISAGRS